MEISVLGRLQRPARPVDADPVAVHRLDVVDDPSEDDVAWYEGLAFEGPLDPAGTLFAFLLALAATVALVVIVAGIVRIAGAA